MGVQGFPTLKIIRPSSKKGKPAVEDYQGARTAKGIVDAIVDKIPNHVKKLSPETVAGWLTATNELPKAILVTEKGTTSALLRSLAVDFLGSVEFGQLRVKDTSLTANYGVTELPSLVLISGASEKPAIHSGEMKREALLSFLSQVATPNPDPALQKGKTAPKSKTKATSSGAKDKKSKEQPPVGFEEFDEIVLDDDTPLQQPIRVEKAEEQNVVPEVIPPIPILSTAQELELACFTPKSGNCIIVLLPIGTGADAVPSEAAAAALAGLAELAHKHSKRNAKIFPFYGVPADNTLAKTIRTELSLKPETELEIISTNFRRSRWRLYASDDVTASSLEAFVDGIRLGEGTSAVLPDSFQPAGSSSEPVAASESPVEPPTKQPRDEL